MKDYRIIPKNPPASLVVMLHGVGANGEDLLGLAEIWQSVFPTTAFISPDAPQPYDMAPFGYQWFSLRDRAHETLVREAKAAAGPLLHYIECVAKEYSVPLSKTVLLGFSQGTMMSLYVGLRMKEQLAGILGYSGMLLGADAPDEITSRPPVCLVHGTSDDVVPAMASEMAMAALGQLNVHCEYHPCRGLGHGINDEGLAAGAAFLRRVLK